MNAPDDLVGPVNLGNPEEFTIKQLAELVIEMTGSRSRLIHAAAAGGRSDAAAARHLAGHAAARLAANRAGPRRSEADYRVVPRDRPESLPAADAELLGMRG